MLRVSKRSSQPVAWLITGLRWLLMIAVPVALVVIELHHPANSAADPYGKLNSMAEEWLRIHLLQAPLFGLVTV
jgi:fumarate reductase subunit D